MEKYSINNGAKKELKNNKIEVDQIISTDSGEFNIELNIETDKIIQVASSSCSCTVPTYTKVDKGYVIKFKTTHKCQKENTTKNVFCTIIFTDKSSRTINISKKCVKN